MSWASTGIIAGASLLLLGAFLVTRYGNERIDYITNAELAGVRQLYQVAPPGSILVATDYVPWKLQQIEAYDYRYLPGDAIGQLDVPTMARIMASAGHHRAYFLVTRSESAQVDLFYSQPGPAGGAGHGSLDRLANAMIASGRFAVVYRNSDSLVLTAIDRGGPT